MYVREREKTYSGSRSCSHTRVALAAAKLDPTNAQIRAEILALAEWSRTWLDEDDSGVIDFERELRDVAAALGNSPAFWEKLEALGIARVEEGPWDGFDGAHARCIPRPRPALALLRKVARA